MSERYLELRLELMTNREDYKKWGKWGCTHILNHRVNKLGQDPDEVFKFVQEKCLKVQPVVEVEPVLSPSATLAPEPVSDPVSDPVVDPLPEPPIAE